METSGKEIRILLIHHRGGSSADEAVDREAALLRGSGFSVERLERRADGDRGLQGRFEDARDLPYSTAARDELTAKLFQFRPKLVHVHEFFPGFTPSVYDACLAAQVPVVQTFHDFRLFCASGKLARNGKPCELCLRGRTLPALRHACVGGSRTATYAVTRMIRRHRAEKTWSSKPAAVIAPSRFSAMKLAEGGVESAKIHVKPGFAFPPPAEAARVAENYALFVGPLTEESGLRTLLRAWEKMKIPLWIVGDGPLRAEAEAQKARNPALRVLGAMPHESVVRIMGKANFLVVPSEYGEAFPHVVADGFAACLPVVASRAGALPELVQQERNGLLFEAGNAENLANVAGVLAKTPKLHEKLSENARATYLERYTPEVNLKNLLEIYRGVLRP